MKSRDLLSEKPKLPKKNVYHPHRSLPTHQGTNLTGERVESVTYIEELSMNAWPSLQTMLYDGWILRFSGGYTKRANSVNPLYESKYEVNKKISECEKLYSGKNIETTFKMTSASCPKDLDVILSERGYQYQAETLLQVLELKQRGIIEAAPDQTLSLSEDVTDEWLSSFCEMNAISESKKQIARQMLENTVPPKRMASISDANGKIIACGLAVLQGDYVGLFDIVIHNEYRRRGLARQLTNSLLNWGKQNGAKRAYLQVVASNEPALNLYRGLGFAEKYRYWFRVKKLQ